MHIWDLLKNFFVQKIVQQLKGFQKWAHTEKRFSMKSAAFSKVVILLILAMKQIQKYWLYILMKYIQLRVNEKSSLNSTHFQTYQ